MTKRILITAAAFATAVSAFADYYEIIPNGTTGFSVFC
jgi:hypothetical protein